MYSGSKNVFLVLLYQCTKTYRERKKGEGRKDVQEKELKTLVKLSLHCTKLKSVEKVAPKGVLVHVSGVSPFPRYSPTDE